MKYALGTIVGTALLGLAKSKIGSNIRLTRIRKKEITKIDRTSYQYYDDSIQFNGIGNLIDQEINQYISNQNLHSSGEYPHVEVFFGENDDFPQDQDEEGGWLFVFSVEVNYTYIENSEEERREAESQLDRISSDLNAIAEKHLENVVYTYRDYETETTETDIILNVETGEEYKPKLSKSSKLRKR